MKSTWPIYFVILGLLMGCQRSNHRLDFSTMTDEELLGHASEVAFGKLELVGDDMERLSEPYRTIVIIYSAQGIIDNGGLQYFYGNDWPKNPPYSVFADAYERIGRTEAAKAIREAASSFDIPNPENDVEKRRAYIEEHYDKDTFEINGWNDCICGDEQVWTDLAAWIREQSEFLQ